MTDEADAPAEQPAAIETSQPPRINGATIGIREPKYNRFGTIDCEIEFAPDDWIPFTADPNDVEAHSKPIYDRALAIGPAAYVAPAPTQTDYATAIQLALDQAAQARNYQDGFALAGYVTDPNPAYATEAQAFINWRSAVWTYANGELAKVLSGTRTPQPSVAQIVSELPAPIWPT